MNKKIVFPLLARILLILAACMVPAIGVALAFGEWACVRAFALSAFIAVLPSVPLRFVRPGRAQMFALDGFAVVGMAWIAVSFFGALPFCLSGAIPSFADSLFESVSGFTTTGATVVPDVDALPKSILYWRSFSHFLGGMGVLTLLLAIAPMGRSAGYSMHLMRAESTGTSVSKLVPRIQNSALILYLLYAATTLVMLVFLLFGGIGPFEAVNIAFSTAGTGGFGLHNSSMAYYSSYIQIVVTVFMAVYSISFTVFFLMVVGEVRRALASEELHRFLALLLGSIALIALNIASLYPTIGEAIRHAAFQVASIMSTSGYATADFNAWPEFSKMILVLLMFVGGCAGSTAGGIKVGRLMILFRSARISLARIVHPKRVYVTHVDGEAVEQTAVEGASTYLVFYGLIMLVSMLILSLDGVSLTTNFTAVVACFNNVGPGLDAVGPTATYAAFSPWAKLLLCAVMLLGRLEIFPLLILVTATFKRSNKKK